MFLMLGITEEQRDLDFRQTVTCPACGRWGAFTVFMTYTVLSLFFIPCIKWGRQYFVRTSCCGKIYRLDAEMGKRIRRGEQVEIRPENLTPVDGGARFTRRCSNCGYTTDEDFEFCPKCGRRF